MEEKTELIPRCYFCRKEVDDDDYCYGCYEYVCQECYEKDGDFPLGKHDVEDHKRGK